MVEVCSNNNCLFALHSWTTARDHPLQSFIQHGRWDSKHTRTPLCTEIAWPIFAQPSFGKTTILLEILWWQNEIGSVFLVATEKHTFQYNLSQNTRIRALVWITVSGRWTYIVSALKEWCFSLLELKSNFGRVQQMI